MRDEVVPRIAALMKTLTTAEWEQRLTAANVPHAVVRDYAGVFADEQILARGMKLTVHDSAGNPVDLVGNPIHLTGAPVGTPTAPPRLGAQTEEVLRELGFKDEEVSALRERGVV